MRTLKPGGSLLYKSGVTCLGDFFDADGRLSHQQQLLKEAFQEGPFWNGLVCVK